MCKDVTDIIQKCLAKKAIAIFLNHNRSVSLPAFLVLKLN